MCWSYEVSLGFGFLELALIVLLYLRNALPPDRSLRRISGILQLSFERGRSRSVHSNLKRNLT